MLHAQPHRPVVRDGRLGVVVAARVVGPGLQLLVGDDLDARVAARVHPAVHEGRAEGDVVDLALVADLRVVAGVGRGEVPVGVAREDVEAGPVRVDAGEGVVEVAKQDDVLGEDRLGDHAGRGVPEPGVELGGLVEALLGGLRVVVGLVVDDHEEEGEVPRAAADLAEKNSLLPSAELHVGVRPGGRNARRGTAVQPERPVIHSQSPSRRSWLGPLPSISGDEGSRPLSVSGAPPSRSRWRSGPRRCRASPTASWR